MKRWLLSFLPSPGTVSRTEQMRGVMGALVGLAVTLLLAGPALAHFGAAGSMLIAPMGASAVLLFCVPASPLAQPWSIVGGNLVASLVGVTCALWLPVAVAAPVAVALAIALMFPLRCLHPPSGAVALTTVVGGSAVHAAGYGFVLAPVLLQSGLLAAAALVYNRALGRRYPHRVLPVLLGAHATRDPAPTARLGFTAGDLDAVLRRYGQVLDVSADDLAELFLAAEAQAYARRFGPASCRDIMSTDVVTVRADTSLAEAWLEMRAHRVHALPVLDARRHLVGIVVQSDLLRDRTLDAYGTGRGRLKAMLRAPFQGPGRTVADVMTRQVRSVRADLPMAELVPMMANTGYHHLPVLEADGRFAGLVTQSDVLAAVYEHRLAEPAAA
ncbi:HPP family protein [Zemynaea arenosa]|nr:HPP family protein [Massilia arenosa]